PVRTCNRGRGPYAPAGALSNDVHERSRVIKSRNSSSAAPCKMTRQRISWLDRVRSASPRARPSRPANSTPRVANISTATQMARNVFTRGDVGRLAPICHVLAPSRMLVCRPMLNILRLLIVILGLCAAASPAHAQPSPDDARRTLDVLQDP